MSMNKLVRPRSWDLGDVPVALIKRAQDRIGPNDLSSFIKRAGHRLADEMRRLQFAPGEIPIHLIAMGSTEYFSSNRNGDGFKEATLRRDHPSFVKKAYFFRDHCNQDPRRSYGIVKASFYNEDMHRVELICALNGTKEAAERNKGLLADKEMDKLASDREIQVSMATRVPYDVCFPAGTPVEVPDGQKAIDEIAVGDRVRTHTGEYRAVTRLIRNPHSGTMVAAEIFGLPDQLKMTEHHPVLVARQEQFRRCRGSVQGKKRRHTYRDGDTCVTCKTRATTHLDWVAARDLHVGDYLVHPVRRPGDVTVGTARAYLAGCYTGNGSPIRQRRGRQRDGEKQLQGLAFSLATAHPEVVRKVQAAATTVHGRLQPVHPAGSNREAVQAHVYHQKLAGDCLRWVGEGSHTKTLAEEVFSWCREDRLALLAGLLDTDGSVDHGACIGLGRIASVNQRLAEQVQKLFWGLGIVATLNRQRCSGGFSAATTECYVVVVPASGVVQLAAYSAKAAGVAAPSFQRSRAFLVGDYLHLPVLELRHYHEECDVFNLSVEEHESYIANHVAVHNCSYCGNKAPTRREYCTDKTCGGGGLRDNITGTLKCGHVLHADNPYCSFFDISHVTRGADPTAAVTGRLEKAASAILSGAELAEILAPGVPGWLDGDTDTPLCKLARALDELDQDELPAMASLDHLPLPPASVKLAEALRALADEKVILSLPDYLHLASGDREKAAACARETAPALPGLFARLANSGEADALAAQSGLHCPVSKSARVWAARVAVARDYKVASIQRRIHTAALRGSNEFCKRASAQTALNPGGVEISRLYGGYALAALQLLEESQKENRLTRLALMAQNRF